MFVSIIRLFTFFNNFNERLFDANEKIKPC